MECNNLSSLRRDASPPFFALSWQKVLERYQTKEQAQQEIFHTYQEDNPLSLREHFRLLIQSGFTSADVLWKKNILALYLARKPEHSAN